MKNTELIVAIESLLLDSTHQMDKLEALAQAYAEACEALNSALVRCISVLREGNSVEAIRLAHSDHVLEDYDTLVLDFINRDLWLEAVKTFTEVSVPNISDQLAEELDACEKKVEDQKDILKRHRLLAYSNAPMYKRIQVLRRLIAQNPKFFEWQKDLELYIQYYYDQLSEEVPKVTKLSVITQIEDEINNVSKISNEILTLSANAPTSLMMAVQARKDKLTQEDAQKRREILYEDLKKIVAVLTASFQKKYFPAGEEAFNFWNICVEKLKELDADPPQELQRRAQEPLKWIRSEKARIFAENEYNKQSILFERTVGSDTIPMETVQKNYTKLQNASRKANIPIPDNLSEALRKREKKWNRTKFHKKFFTVLIILFLVTSVGFAGYFGWKTWLQNQIVSNITQNLTHLKHKAEVDSDYENAIAYADKIVKEHPEEARLPKVQILLDAIRNGDKDNRERQQKFTELAQTLNTQIVKEHSTDPIMKERLNKLKKLARSMDENTEFDELNAQFLENQKNKVASQDRKFENEADSLLKKIRNLASDSEEAPRELQNLEDQIDKLKKWPDPVSPPLMKQKCSALAEALSLKKEECKSHQKDLELQMCYAKEFDDLVSNTTDIQSYIMNLEEYLDFVRDNPCDDVNVDPDVIENRLKDTGLWKRIIEWNKFIEMYGSVMNASQITPVSARNFLKFWNESGESLLVDKDQPWNDLLLKKIATLQKLTTTTTNATLSENIQELVNKCNQMSIRDYYYARNEKTGNWYYFVEADTKKFVKPPYPYVTEWDNVDGQKTPSESVFQRDFRLSPHVKLCRMLVKTTKMLQDSFEENAPLLLEMIQRDYFGGQDEAIPELDPLIAWSLLTTFTEKLGECNPDFQKAYDPLLKVCQQYDKLSEIQVKPLRPDETTRGQRDMAIQVFRTLQEENLFEECKAKFLSTSNISAEKCAGVYRMVGFLADDGQRITIYPILQNTNLSGPLWVCRENSDLDTEIEFLEIGKIKKGVIDTNFYSRDPKKFQYAPVFVFEYVK